eukprot:Nitzschia sp. Nitz4//scaffold108_size72880//66205//68919//NITZ4_005830-RA/size72880-processed-gene-0.45-mRNA-1//1//CDS//3329532714//4129//frame0
MPSGFVRFPWLLLLIMFLASKRVQSFLGPPVFGRRLLTKCSPDLTHPRIVRSSNAVLGPTSLSRHFAVDASILGHHADKDLLEQREREYRDPELRNKRIRSLLRTSSNQNFVGDGSEIGNFTAPPLYAVKVWVDETLRDELRLSGREKRGRVFVEAGSDGVLTFRGLKMELYDFFRALRKDSFILTAMFPTVSEEGNVITLDNPDPDDCWKIETDDDVVATFEAADSFFQNATSANKFMKRPSIQINVLKNPNAPPPPPIPAYLVDMEDPSETPSMTMISFYSFPPAGIQDPDNFAMELRKKWRPFRALGRVYVAEEGVNAQMSIPTNVLSNFMDCCRSILELGEYMENDINIDPKPIPMDEFPFAGVPLNGHPAPPFRNLHVRVRSQIVADGLDKSFDWQSAGYDCPPLEWHDRLKAMKEKRSSRNGTSAAEGPVLLDCRNSYESDIGTFEGFEPLNTENFRESWDILEKRLENLPKDTEIMAFCTGGIRCVKVGAYLTQEMGFTNVSRLAGGVIAYDRALNYQMEGEESMFKGTNFVFDGRLGRAITDDNLAQCVTCGKETSHVTNCRNDSCHKRITQCEDCQSSFNGTCSTACKERLQVAATRQHQLDTGSEENLRYDSLDDYCLGHSTSLPYAFKAIEANTREHFPSGAHMISGEAQGQLLSQLTSMTRNGRVLEIGTFSGYATASFVQGARNAGRAIGAKNGNAQSGPYVLSMERQAQAFNLAAAHLKAICMECNDEKSAEKIKKYLHDVPEESRQEVSLTYDGTVGCDLWHVNDALATLEAMAAGKGASLPAPFDLVFIDADKSRYLDYVEACLSSDRILGPGGIILVDNVLWKGLVMDASSGDLWTKVVDTEVPSRNRRLRKVAHLMHRFNQVMAKDSRVEVNMLPIRDGISIIRKL